jgi:hypothetical protein
MKKLLSIMPLIFFSIIISFFAGDVKADSYSAIDKSLIADGFSVPDVNSRGEIIKQIKSFEAMTPGEPFSEQPLLAKPFKAGELTDKFLNHGLASVNLHRFFAGLPFDVELDNDWNFMAQHGAALLAIMKKGLSHDPAYPEGIGLPREFYNRGYTGASTGNLHSGQGDLAQAVKGFVHDSDSSNINRLGHRRWVLDPGLEKTGFGYVNGYVVMKVFDHGVSSKRKEKFAYAAWPPAGEMALEYFPGNSAWSFSLNPYAFGKITGDEEAVTVTLKRTRDGKTWSFGGSSGKDGYFNINKEPFGLPYCIIFRPDNLGIIKDNDAFEVKINGITDIRGRDIPVQYKTVFFNTGEKITSDAVSKYPSALKIDCSFTTTKYGKRNAKADNGQITFGYTGLFIRGFSVTVDSPEGIIPVGFSINKSEKIFGPGDWVSDGGKEITSLKVLSSAGGYNIKFAVFCKEKGWSTWANAGEELSFGTSYPIESVSIIIKQD